MSILLSQKRTGEELHLASSCFRTAADQKTSCSSNAPRSLLAGNHMQSFAPLSFQPLALLQTFATSTVSPERYLWLKKNGLLLVSACAFSSVIESKGSQIKSKVYSLLKRFKKKLISR